MGFIGLCTLIWRYKKKHSSLIQGLSKCPFILLLPISARNTLTYALVLQLFSVP